MSRNFLTQLLETIYVLHIFTKSRCIILDDKLIPQKATIGAWL